MKIESLKINSFGKLENIEISLKEKINIIYGNNESGKSTILKFIAGMLYGLSKNKNGKEISDYEKYKPWKKDEYSGKIKYKLDNEETYEIFRDFHKKNPEIFLGSTENITKQFSIDKNKGNEFFREQTNIEENLFFHTAGVMQEEIKLDKTDQNVLIQKITNLISSGDDNISYKKSIEKLNRKLIEEVGTNRTIDRPINLIEEKIQKIKSEEKNIEELNQKLFYIEENKNEIQQEIILKEQEINLLKKIKQEKEIENIEQEKLKINKKIEEEINKKIEENKNKLNLIKEEKIKINKANNIIFFVLFFLIIFLNIIFWGNNIILFLGIMLNILIAGIYFFKKIKIKNKNKINSEKIIQEKNKIKNEIEILEENKKNKIKENKIIEKEIDEKIIQEKNKIKNEEKNYFIEIEKIFNLNLFEINTELEKKEKEYQNNQIKLHTLEIDKKSIEPLIEKQIEQNENLNYLLEEQKELNELGRAINLAKEELENSYYEMKNKITPKFTQQLSYLINLITNEKYQILKLDEQNNLIVELQDGNYKNCNSLSIGTIDQMYLALRLSALEEITKEKIPILLDEAFCYYDEKRLENILKILYNNYDNQIIIFTCTKREKEILDKMKVKYNYTEI